MERRARPRRTPHPQRSYAEGHRPQPRPDRLALSLEEIAPAHIAAAAQAEDQRHDEADYEQDEQHLRDAGGAGRDAAEAEEGRDEREDEETDGPAQHDFLRVFNGGSQAAICVPAPGSVTGASSSSSLCASSSGPSSPSAS